jgi:hypothetical protein
MKDRLIIGLIETVILESGKKYKAKIDTGADSSSIDKKIAESLGEKKILSHKIIRSALGRHRRPTIKVGLKLQEKYFEEKFSISDRSKLKYKILIGKDILKKEGFLIDPLLEVK